MRRVERRDGYLFCRLRCPKARNRRPPDTRMKPGLDSVTSSCLVAGSFTGASNHRNRRATDSYSACSLHILCVRDMSNRRVYNLHINNTARSQGVCRPRGRLEPSAIYAKSEPFVLLMLRQSTDRADRPACVVYCDAPCAFHSNTFVYFVWKVQRHPLLSLPPSPLSQPGL